MVKMATSQNGNRSKRRQTQTTPTVIGAVWAEIGWVSAAELGS